MDFRQTTQPAPSGRPLGQQPAPEDNGHTGAKAPNPKTKKRNWFSVFNGVMLVGIAILVACTALALTRSNSSNASAEAKYVDTGKYQAVFLNNGQVYFGNVTALDHDFVRLTNVFYLTQDSESKESNYTLVKLGCQQIHNPYDSMVINRDQVTFWENLKDDGKVVTSIEKFKKENPNGPDCSQVSNETQATSSNTQGGTAKP